MTAEETVTIPKRMLAFHMHSHAVSLGCLAYDRVAEVVSRRKAELDSGEAQRTIFVRQPDGTDSSESMAVIDALVEASWMGVPFGSALWAVQFDDVAEAVHFVLSFDSWIVKA